VNLRPGRTRIKFCGITTPAEAALAAEAGADAIGVILAESPRRVEATALPELAAAVPPFITKVGVLAGAAEGEAARLRALGFVLQFSGSESPALCERTSAGATYIKAFHVRRGISYDAADFAPLEEYAHALWMFDAKPDERLGGSGTTFMWDIVEPLARRRRVIIAGGLTPENVGACVRAVRPFAVDVRSGIETGDAKDPEKMRAFVRAVREADAQA